jgi:uncharacterized membrane protein
MFKANFVFIGVLITFIGAILVFKALKALPQELRTRAKSKKIILFIGSTPLIINGSRKWIITTLGIAGIIFIILLTRNWFLIF